MYRKHVHVNFFFMKKFITLKKTKNNLNIREFWKLKLKSTVDAFFTKTQLKNAKRKKYKIFFQTNQTKGKMKHCRQPAWSRSCCS
jgi:hypothetical protein